MSQFYGQCVMKSCPASLIQNYCLILSFDFGTTCECVLVLQVPAGVFSSGHRRGHLSLQGPDCGWRSGGLFRSECGCLLGVPARRHAQIPEGARRTRQLRHPGDNGETLFIYWIYWILQCFRMGFVSCQRRPGNSFHFVFSVQQKTVHELWLHRGKRGNTRGNQPWRKLFRILF